MLPLRASLLSLAHAGKSREIRLPWSLTVTASCPMNSCLSPHRLRGARRRRGCGPAYRSVRLGPPCRAGTRSLWLISRFLRPASKTQNDVGETTPGVTPRKEGLPLVPQPGCVRDGALDRPHSPWGLLVLRHPGQKHRLRRPMPRSQDIRGKVPGACPHPTLPTGGSGTPQAFPIPCRGARKPLPLDRKALGARKGRPPGHS